MSILWNPRIFRVLIQGAKPTTYQSKNYKNFDNFKWEFDKIDFIISSLRNINFHLSFNESQKTPKPLQISFSATLTNE